MCAGNDVLSLEEWLRQHSPKALLLDACGVFLECSDGTPLPGAQQTMAALKQRGMMIGVLSNASTVAERQLVKIAKYGWQRGTHFDFYLTSGDITRAYLQQTGGDLRGKQYLELGPVHPRYGAIHRAIFDDLGMFATQEAAEAHFVVAHIPHEAGHDITDLGRLEQLYAHEITAAIESGLSLLSINPDVWVIEGSESGKVARQGALAALYRERGGSVISLGKPAPLAFRYALQEFARYGIEDSRGIWMVGDNPATDIRGARAVGLSTALVVATGVWAGDQGFLADEELPTVFLDRLADARFCTEYA